VTDRRTKAQLLERIDELTNRLEVVPLLKKEAPAPEGVAVSECIRALGSLQTPRPTSWSGDPQPDCAAIGRVLRLLASRFDVPLVEVRTEPCSRSHVDEIDSYALTNAIRSVMTR
jgi:hypothetical protein